MITDDSVMQFGKYRGNLMRDIPISYLREFYNGNYKNPTQTIGFNYDELYDYLSIRSSIKSSPPEKPFKASGSIINDRVNSAIETLCPKEFFISESDAKYRLNHIRNKTIEYHRFNRVIPVRTYYCDKCGYWHLTSQASVSKFDSVVEVNKKEIYEPVLKDSWLKLMEE